MNTPRTAAEFIAPSPGNHIAPLDGLRGSAVLMVFFHHSMSAGSVAATMPFERVLVSVLGAGWIGVDVFFALSGFLITGILLDTKSKQHYFLNFFARRTLRIFPLYFLFLFLLFVVFAPVLENLYSPGEAFSSLEHAQGWFWTYSQNWYFVLLGRGSLVPVTQLWSLAVEEQFYLVWPFVVFVCSARRITWVAAACCVIGPFIRLVLLRNGWSDTSVYMSTLSRIDALLIGALLAAWLRTGMPIPSPKRAAIAFLFVLAGGLLITLLIDHGLKRNGIALQTIGLTVISASAALLILVVISASPQSGVNRLLTGAWLRSAGKYSYAMYIFHPPVLWGLAALIKSHRVILVPGTHLFTLGYVVFVSTALAVTYLASFLSWHLYERHFLSLKKRFGGLKEFAPLTLNEPRSY